MLFLGSCSEDSLRHLVIACFKRSFVINIRENRRSIKNEQSRYTD
jgi:hypothetical protein